MNSPILLGHQHPDIGCPVSIPTEHLDSLAILLRVLIALAEGEDDQTLGREGEPYEVLAKRLEFYRTNLLDLSQTARQLLVEQH